MACTEVTEPRLRGGDALLQLAHLGGQGGLVAHGRGHAAQQGRDFRPRLHETEDVVDEEKHVLAHDVAEVLRHGQRRQTHAQTGARRLVHLAEHHGGLVDDARLAHLQVEVVALAGALAHAGEHRDAAVVGGDAVDELQDDDGLAHAGAAEQADLAALDVGSQQVDDLDAGLEDLGGGLQFFKGRSGTVDGPPLHVGGKRFALVDGLAQQVEQPAQSGLAHGHGDGLAGVDHFHAAGEAVGGVHGHRAHLVVAQVLLHFGDQVDPARRGLDVDLEGVVDGRQRLGELHIEHRPDDLYDLAFVHRLFVSSLGWSVTASSLSGQRVRAGHHFQDLLGDGRLPHPVHCQGQIVDHLVGRLRSGAHGRHPGAVLAGHALQDGPDRW